MNFPIIVLWAHSPSLGPLWAPPQRGQSQQAETSQAGQAGCQASARLAFGLARLLFTAFWFDSGLGLRLDFGVDFG